MSISSREVVSCMFGLCISAYFWSFKLCYAIFYRAAYMQFDARRLGGGGCYTCASSGFISRSMNQITGGNYFRGWASYSRGRRQLCFLFKKKKKKNGLSNKCAPGKFPRQFNGIMRNAIGFNLSGIETIIIVIIIISPLHRQLLKYNRRCIWGSNVWDKI